MRKIPFCKINISDNAIKEVVDTLKSGWITTGPKTALFEERLKDYLNVDAVACLNSATAGLELSMRLFGIGEGDEVITTPYTFAATVNVIEHCGAVPVLADVGKDTFNIDPEKIARKISSKTKAVIPVDFAGYPCDYKSISDILNKNVSLFEPSNPVQEDFARPLIISDSAHSLGSLYNGERVSDKIDFAVYSFHAVKNLTTAEGGCVAFRNTNCIDAEAVKKEFKIMSLHGQSKDALAKLEKGSWEYDIKYAGYKYNMTDIQASLGLVHLSEYGDNIAKRRSIFNTYNEAFSSIEELILPGFNGNEKVHSAHLYPLRVRGYTLEERASLIENLYSAGIHSNVHFKPIPLLTAYSKKFNIKDFPNAMEMYTNEISLPIYPSMTDDDVQYVIDAVIVRIKE